MRYTREERSLFILKAAENSVLFKMSEYNAEYKQPSLGQIKYI